MAGLCVTGVSGIVGSTLARQLREAGHEVHGLARPGGETAALEALGVRIHRGDVARYGDVLEAGRGCEAVFHCAAVLGGPNADPVEMEKTNVRGTVNAFEAAQALGMRRVVAFSTPSVFDAGDGPYTERSPLLDPQVANQDPYTRTKTAAFVEAKRRIAAGSDAVIVVPAGMYGPNPQLKRSLTPPSNNLRIVWALRGEVRDYVAFPVPWSYSEDVARCAVAALERGKAGEVYLAFGDPQEATSFAGFMDRACRVAGVAHRVRELSPDELDSPEALKRFGPTLINMAKRRYPQPLWDNRYTKAQLGLQPLRLDDGIARTIAALREQQLL